MKYRLYYRRQFLGEFDDFGAAEAEARWNYFVRNNRSWEDYQMPAGYFILSTEVAVA